VDFHECACEIAKARSAASPEIVFAKGESDEKSFGVSSYWIDRCNRTAFCGASVRAVWWGLAGAGLAGDEGGVGSREPVDGRDVAGANATVGKRNGEGE
jgi:hypothetical protein